MAVKGIIVSSCIVYALCFASIVSFHSIFISLRDEVKLVLSLLFVEAGRGLI